VRKRRLKNRQDEKKTKIGTKSKNNMDRRTQDLGTLVEREKLH